MQILINTNMVFKPKKHPLYEKFRSFARREDKAIYEKTPERIAIWKKRFTKSNLTQEILSLF